MSGEIIDLTGDDSKVYSSSAVAASVAAQGGMAAPKPRPTRDAAGNIIFDAPKVKPKRKATKAAAKQKAPASRSAAGGSGGSGVSGSGFAAVPAGALPVFGSEKRPVRKRSFSAKVNERISRAVYQRMFLLSRNTTRTIDYGGKQFEMASDFKVIGSTGNVYDVTIDSKVQCSCPDFIKGNLCKHVLFVMLKVLRVGQRDPVLVQKGLLQEELFRIFQEAPRNVRGALADEFTRSAYQAATGDDVGAGEAEAKKEAEKGVTQKSLDDEDCAICYEEFKAGEAVVWCRSSCGKNVHTACFQMWAATAREKGTQITCVYCRAPWSSGQPKAKKRSRSSADAAHVEHTGYGTYVNLADEAGLPSERDTSTYHSSDYYGGYGYRRRGRRW